MLCIFKSTKIGNLQDKKKISFKDLEKCKKYIKQQGRNKIEVDKI